jgi:ribonucleoside-diphosphate reductase beta chain
MSSIILTPQERALKIINNRRVIFGEDDELMAPSPKKYAEPIAIMDKALRDDWKHWHVNLVDDLADFRTLNPKACRSVQMNLGFLSNLDGIQLSTLANNIQAHVTAPEYRMALTRQAYEELVHVLTYDRMITSLDMDPIETYNLFMTDEILAAKNQHIIKMANLLGDDFTGENFVRAIVANQALEGVYFQMGFKRFYILHKSGKMPGCAKNIRYIQRDEASHLRIFNSMFREIRKENPELFTVEVLKDCGEILRLAAEMEMTWNRHVNQGGQLGVTDEISDGSIMFGTNGVARAVGIEAPFPQVTKDPLAWTDAYLNEHGIETNFFEDRVVEYEDRGLEWD